MKKSPRCLFNSDFEIFLNLDENAILGTLCDNYHGTALTTTIEAWKSEIIILKNVVSKLNDGNGQKEIKEEIIINTLKYDIPSVSLSAMNP